MMFFLLHLLLILNLSSLANSSEQLQQSQLSTILDDKVPWRKKQELLETLFDSGDLGKWENRWDVSKVLQYVVRSISKLDTESEKWKMGVTRTLKWLCYRPKPRIYFHKHLENVQVMLENSHKLNIDFTMEVNGDTVFDQACRWGWPELIDLFIDHWSKHGIEIGMSAKCLRHLVRYSRSSKEMMRFNRFFDEWRLYVHEDTACEIIRSFATNTLTIPFFLEAKATMWEMSLSRPLEHVACMVARHSSDIQPITVFDEAVEKHLWWVADWAFTKLDKSEICGQPRGVHLLRELVSDQYLKYEDEFERRDLTLTVIKNWRDYDPDFFDPQKSTPSWLRVCSTPTSSALVLVKAFNDLPARDFDRTVLDSNNQNALHRAVLGGKLDVVQYILDDVVSGRLAIDIARRNTAGQSPFFLACMAGNWKLAKLLKQVGGKAFSLTETDNSGTTVFEAAVSSKRQKIVRWMAGMAQRTTGREDMGLDAPGKDKILRRARGTKDSDLVRYLEGFFERDARRESRETKQSV